MVRTLRLMLARRGDLHLIYGVTEQTVSFAEKLRSSEKGFILFVDTGSGAALEGSVLAMGGLMLDGKAPSPALLKKIGMKRGARRLMLYCLDGSDTNDLRYAEAMRKALEEANVSPEQTSLTILVADGGSGAALQAEEGKYGYGSVSAFERPELISRLMVRRWAPCDTLEFDEKARAREDFEALIIGFGAAGQAALRSLVMNGQFEGSRFRAVVVSKDRKERAGSFYIAVCTGDEKENAEIAMELSDFFGSRGMDPVIVQCSSKDVSRIDKNGGLLTTVDMFAPEILVGSRLDKAAMLLNHRYHESEGNTPEEDWKNCDYFSRMSCRAAADYARVFIRAAGLDQGETMKNGFDPSPEVMENLARTEHLRWCAFHYAMGYDAMPESMFEERAAVYKKQLEETGRGSIRIGKDTVGRFHACLIPWEELPALAEREREITGKLSDYYKMDVDNVRLAVEMSMAADSENGGTV